MSPRGERTREQILDAAELLYGDRGVDAVSLREIRLAADQRNTSAIQFHFGGADGLLVALAERHLPLLAARQVEVRCPSARTRARTSPPTSSTCWSSRGPTTSNGVPASGRG